MRVRIHMTSGDAVDAEEFSSDNGSTWAAIGVPQVAAAMAATTGYTVVRDVLTGQWRSFRNVAIESIGPAGDLSEVVAAEVERRIQAILASQLPKRVAAVVDPVPPAAMARSALDPEANSDLRTLMHTGGPELPGDEPGPSSVQ